MDTTNRSFVAIRSPAMTEHNPHAPTVAAYFAGINAERYADVGALFADSGELVAPGVDARRGADDIANYFAAALKPYPEHLDDPVRVNYSGDSATVEIHFTGRTANGFELEFDAVDIFDFTADGKILRLSSWYDSHAVRQQLRRSRETVKQPT
jgi:ketosteroid isomerase-like protein